jgi:hypothetical protein
MSTKLRASLEDAIDKWAQKEAEKTESWFNDTYWGDTMTASMAEAAYAVMMAAHEAQLYADAENAA